LSLHANEAVFEWVKRVTGGGSELLVGISNDSQGNLYVIGHFGSTIKINPDGKTHGITSLGYDDTFVAKMDARRNIIWVRHIGGTNNVTGRAICTAPDGSVWITGEFEGTLEVEPGSGIFQLTATNRKEFFFIKLDINGNFLWGAKTTGENSLGIRAKTIVSDAVGNVYV